MYFDVRIYRAVFSFVWAQKSWPGRRNMLIRLVVIEPLLALAHHLFFLADHVFFPGFRNVNVEEPVFIVGHARSGTTLMHRLMAEDADRFSYFRYWEMFAPSITLRKAIRGVQRLDRRLFGLAIYRKLRAWDEKAFEPFRHIHDMSLWNPEEDQFVMHPAFVTQQWMLAAPLLHLVDIFHLDQVEPRRRRGWLRFYRGCIQRQLYLCGPGRTHLSKNPVMSGWVSGLLEEFPDARFLVMVRDTMQCIPSTLKLLETNWESKEWDPADFAASLVRMKEISYDSFDLPREALSDSEVPHQFVDYRDLVTSPAETLSAAYRALGIELDGESIGRGSKSEPGSHVSTFEYTAEEYGLDGGEVIARLRRHYDVFGWPHPDEEADT